MSRRLPGHVFRGGKRRPQDEGLTGLCEKACWGCQCVNKSFPYVHSARFQKLADEDDKRKEYFRTMHGGGDHERLKKCLSSYERSRPPTVYVCATWVDMSNELVKLTLNRYADVHPDVDEANLDREATEIYVRECKEREEQERNLRFTSEIVKEVQAQKQQEKEEEKDEQLQHEEHTPPGNRATVIVNQDDVAAPERAAADRQREAAEEREREMQESRRARDRDEKAARERAAEKRAKKLAKKEKKKKKKSRKGKKRENRESDSDDRDWSDGERTRRNEAPPIAQVSSSSRDNSSGVASRDDQIRQYYLAVQDWQQQRDAAARERREWERQVKQFQAFLTQAKEKEQKALSREQAANEELTSLDRTRLQNKWTEEEIQRQQQLQQNKSHKPQQSPLQQAQYQQQQLQQQQLQQQQLQQQQLQQQQFQQQQFQQQQHYFVPQPQAAGGYVPVGFAAAPTHPTMAFYPHHVPQMHHPAYQNSAQPTHFTQAMSPHNAQPSALLPQQPPQPTSAPPPPSSIGASKKRTPSSVTSTASNKNSPRTAAAAAAPPAKRRRPLPKDDRPLDPKRASVRSARENLKRASNRPARDKTES